MIRIFMTLEQMAAWKSSRNPLESVLGKNSICPTITTRVAESIGGGINASTILICEDLEDTTNVRYLYENRRKSIIDNSRIEQRQN